MNLSFYNIVAKRLYYKTSVDVTKWLFIREQIIKNEKWIYLPQNIKKKEIYRIINVWDSDNYNDIYIVNHNFIYRGNVDVFLNVYNFKYGLNNKYPINKIDISKELDFINAHIDD